MRLVVKHAAAALACAVALATAVASAAQPPAGFVKPGKGEKCPVCGMFAYKYPDWIAEILFADGSREVFDGAKDLFRYYLDMRGFGGKRGQGDVSAVFMTDYYSLEPIDGRTAHYVIGSDVYGPMGKELIPFARRADAEEFLRDHGGRKIVVFNEVAPELPALVE
jgi:nitrous oxide reductase accessory protein NosL